MRPAQRSGRWAGAVLACALLGCQTTVRVAGRLPPPAPLAAPPSGLRAGAAMADITPLPGFPLGGHAIGGALGRGTWTRLWARAFYFEDAGGSCLVLCACDLWSICGSLADRVAELVARDAGAAHVPRERIVLAATHTHHGPAAFTAHTVYATNAGRLAGFDPDLHEFLAQRIAGCIVQAARGARPATLAWGGARLVKTQRNRSLDAFALNPEAGQVVAESGETAPEEATEVDAMYPNPLAWRAVDRRVRALAVRAASGELIGTAAFVACHPTSMRARTEVYHGDVFAVASIRAASALAEDAARPPVVALFNGAEGDVSPFWRQQDRPETVANGEQVAAAIVRAVRQPERTLEAPSIAGAFARVPLAAQRWRDAGGNEHATAPRPVPGAAQLGGAEDGRTFLYDLGYVEGVRGIRHQTAAAAGHGVKLPAFEPAFDLEGFAPLLAALLPDLTKVLAPVEDFPARVPLGVYRLGDLWFATLPGEFTTVMGRRAARLVAERAGAAPDALHVIGLANEYVSYFTTPEEYEAQHYEGASTLFGPESGPWIAHSLGELAAAAQAHVPRSDPASYEYDVRPLRHFGWADLGEPPLRHDDGLDALIVDAAHRPRRDLPHVEWWEPRTGFDELNADSRRRAVPHVRVRNARGEVVADAAGTDLLTVALRATGDRVQWSAIWLATERDPVAGVPTFWVVDADGTERAIEAGPGR